MWSVNFSPSNNMQLALFLYLSLILFATSAKAACCTDGETKADPSNCQNYLECCGGEFVSKSCSNGYYWNNGCVVDNGECNPNPVCKDGETKADPNNCQNYLECCSGEFVSKSCNNGYYWNNGCVVDNGECNPNPVCKDGETKADPNNCQNYLECSNGQFVSKSCSNGYYWNNGCVVDNGECNPSPVCKDGETKADSANCQNYYECSNGQFVSKSCSNGYYWNNGCVVDNGECNPSPVCKDGETKADSANCQNYYECSNGQFVSKSCSNGYYWNNGCVVDNGECNPSPVCKDGETKADSANCQNYYECSNGQFVSKSCSNGYYWNNGCVVDNGECNPSPVCKDGETKADSANCQNYYECSNGQFVSKSCSNGYYWNNGCVVDNGECNPNPTCEEGQIKENPANCAGYLQCTNGQFVNVNCAAGSYFLVSQGICVPDTDGVCVNKTCDPECCNVASDTLLPVEKNCSAFIACLDGFKFDFTCPNNLQFNNITKECDYPENVQCEDGSDPNGPSAGPSGTICESKGRCARQPDGSKFSTVQTGCSTTFITCQCECEVIFDCPNGLVFNQEIQVCDWPGNVAC